MTKQEFATIETDDQAIRFAKRVSSRQIESPLSKAEWMTVIEAQAEANITDPALSKQQKFAKYLDTEVGRELFFALKATRAEGAADAVSRQVDFVKTAGSLDGGENTIKPAQNWTVPPRRRCTPSRSTIRESAATVTRRPTVMFMATETTRHCEIRSRASI